MNYADVPVEEKEKYRQFVFRCGVMNDYQCTVSRENNVGEICIVVYVYYVIMDVNLSIYFPKEVKRLWKDGILFSSPGLKHVFFF